jgi:uncharacterized membrane protein YqjE
VSDAQAGLLGSLRALLGTALQVVQTRLELFTCELEQEKTNLFDALWWAALSLVLLSAGLVLAIGLIVLLMQEGYRLPALGLLTLSCVGGGWALLRHAKRCLHSPGGAFAASVGEIARDRAGLGGVDPSA